jgi:hypothetical protein
MRHNKIQYMDDLPAHQVAEIAALIQSVGAVEPQIVAHTLDIKIGVCHYESDLS